MNESLVFALAVIMVLIICIVFLMWLFKKKWQSIFTSLRGGFLGGIAGYFFLPKSIGFIRLTVSGVDVLVTYEQARIINGLAVGLVLAMALIFIFVRKKNLPN